MGRPKALLSANPVGHPGPEVSFLARLHATFSAAGLAPIVVVAGVHDEAIRAHVRERQLDVAVVTNPDPSRGQLSSLWCALDEVERLSPSVEAVVMTPVDHPWASAETVQRLVREFQRTGAPIVRPLAADGAHGHPVVFSARTFPLLRRASLAQGAKAVITALAAEIHHVPLDDTGAFADVDTPDDYERLRARSESGPNAATRTGRSGFEADR